MHPRIDNSWCGPFLRCVRWTGLLLLLSGVFVPRGAHAIGWYPLFDGLTLQGWTTLDGKPVTRGWKVEQTMIHLDTSGQRGGQIITDRDYGDFELFLSGKSPLRGIAGSNTVSALSMVNG